jgi:hypothetical protein
MMITNTSDEQKNVDQIVGIDNSDYTEDDYIDDSDVEYVSDDDSDYEEDDYEEDDEEEDDEYDEEEELHQLYRQQAFEFEQDEDIPDLISDDDRESDTEELVEEQSIVIGPPPVLTRERPEDYLTPIRNTEVITPRAPERRRVLADLTNITPRRLAFN